MTPSIAFGAHHRQPLWQSRLAKSVCKFCKIVRPDRARGPLHRSARGRTSPVPGSGIPASASAPNAGAQVADVCYPAVTWPYGRSRDGRADASPGGWWSCCRVCTLSLSQIRSGRIGDAVRRDGALRRSDRRLELRHCRSSLMRRSPHQTRRTRPCKRAARHAVAGPRRRAVASAVEAACRQAASSS